MFSHSNNYNTAHPMVFQAPAFFYALRFACAFEEFLGAFLPALLVSRLIVQTTTAKTAFGCPQTPAKGYLRRATHAIEVR
jgi:hypothetical protein